LQLYLSLLYNSFSEKDRGMTKEVLMKKVQEAEGIVVTLTNENLALKESLTQAQQSFSLIEENLNMTTEVCVASLNLFLGSSLFLLWFLSQSLDA
jgi:hypothetical protein